MVKGSPSEMSYIPPMTGLNCTLICFGSPPQRLIPTFPDPNYGPPKLPKTNAHVIYIIYSEQALNLLELNPLSRSPVESPIVGIQTKMGLDREAYLD